MNDNYDIPHDPVFTSMKVFLTTQGYFPWEKYITSLEIYSRLIFVHFLYNTFISGNNFIGIQTIDLTAKNLLTLA